MRVLDPQPAAEELPVRFPSPFARAPHALARRAADELMRELRAVEVADGKMFGVLVCARGDGVVGVLRAFSGMLGGRWLVDGFAPPVFDLAARDAWWLASEAELAELEARRVAIAEGEPARSARDALAAVEARHASEASELRARHAANRAARHADRVDGVSDQESRRDTAEKREHKARHASELAAARARVAESADAAAAIGELRAERSRTFLARIHAGYAWTSARGETRTLRELFAPAAPPGGAGDCAAPKLLAHAHRLGLAPLALAEFWWGPGDRQAGAFYPACRGKCGPILPFLLDGIACEAAPQFGGGPIAADEPRVLFADAHVVVVAKPCGLLSVPGRGGALRDSVLSRLRARDPRASGPIVVHRLDLDVSGVLLAARDSATHAALQAQFARREIGKRYIAWLDGEVAGDAGVIDLPMRGDLDDRPRQIVDPVHGKPAVTAWRVLARDAGRTRIELSPKTGRTHQLRVHCARGLSAPIHGDALYGRAAEEQRLELHAEAITFVHPATGEVVTVEWPAPF